MTQLYIELARALMARQNCIKSGNAEGRVRHEQRIAELCEELPHGSGIDGDQPALDLDRSTANRLVIVNVDFHHMDECGGYDGWTSHEIIVTSSLAFCFDLRVTGRDRNGIKDYLAEIFSAALSADAPAQLAVAA